MIWLLEKDCFTENEKEIEKTLLEQKHEVRFIENKILSEDYYKSFLPENSCVSFYGSLSLARLLRRSSPWIPGVFCNLTNFDCQKYYSYYGKYLLNSNYAIMSLSELIRQWDFIFSVFGILEHRTNQNQIFVRPCSGFKEFAGKVFIYEQKNLSNFDFGFYYDNAEELMVVVSTFKNIDKEEFAPSDNENYRKHCLNFLQIQNTSTRSKVPFYIFEQLFRKDTKGMLLGDRVFSWVC
jgi:hypothetical protein